MTWCASHQHRIEIFAGDHAVGTFVYRRPDLLFVPLDWNFGGSKNGFDGVGDLGANSVSREEGRRERRFR